MQDLTSWSFNDHENRRNQPRTTREDLVNDLKAAGTLITKKTIGNTLRRDGLKSCRSHCSRKHMYSTGPSEVCQWFRGELGESVGVRWDQNRAFGINSTHCVWRRRNGIWPQEHHPHRQTRRWKHYALGVFFCQGTLHCTASKGRLTGPCTVRARALKLARALKMGRG